MSAIKKQLVFSWLVSSLISALGLFTFFNLNYFIPLLAVGLALLSATALLTHQVLLHTEQQPAKSSIVTSPIGNESR